MSTMGIMSFIASDWNNNILLGAIFDLAGDLAKSTGDLIILGEAASILDEPDFDALVFLSRDVGLRTIASVLMVNGRRRIHVG